VVRGRADIPERMVHAGRAIGWDQCDIWGPMSGHISPMCPIGPIAEAAADTATAHRPF
jgi:hypothetical protein